MGNFSLSTAAVLTGWGLLCLYVFPLVLTQTWLLRLDRRTRWFWVGLQLLLLFVCLGLLPLVPVLCFAVLLGAPFILPFAALVGGLLCATFFLWQRAVPWFAQHAFQGCIPNLKQRLGLSLLGSALVWWQLPLVSSFFPSGFKPGLLVLLGVAVGQITGRYLRR